MVTDIHGCLGTDTISVHAVNCDGIEELNSNIDILISPNPFSDQTLLQFDLQNPSDVELIIYNLLGEKVFEIPVQKMNTGKQQMKIYLPDQASGVLMYELRVNGNAVRGKMIKE